MLIDEEDSVNSTVVKTTPLGAAMNVARLCFGTGILALPYATTRGGLILSPLVIIFIGWWNGHACKLLSEAKAECGDLSYSNLPSTYSKIAKAGCGRSTVVFTDFAVIITQLGVCLTYIITFASLVRGIPDNFFSHGVLALFCGLLSYPMSCLKDSALLSSISFVGVFCLLCMVLAVVLNGFYLYGDESFKEMDPVATEKVSLEYFPQSLEDLAIILGVSSFCFDLGPLTFPIAENMENSQHFLVAVRWSIVCACFVYVLFGELGSILYDHATDGVHYNILINLPTDNRLAIIGRIAMAWVCVLTIPINFIPACQILEFMILKSFPDCFGRYGYLPITDSDNSNQGGDTSFSQYALQMRLQQLEQENINGNNSKREPLSYQQESQVPIINNSINYSFCPDNSMIFRLIHRFILMMILVLIAFIFPCFGDIVAILGISTMAILNFILPPLFHMILVSAPNIPFGYKLPFMWDLFLLLTGFMLCCVGLVMTVADIIERRRAGGEC